MNRSVPMCQIRYLLESLFLLVKLWELRCYQKFKQKMENEILTTIIAAVTSLVTVIFIKPSIDKSFLKFQLKQNYIANQSKKVKEHIAIHKGRLLKSAELLNNRLKNFAKNYNEQWLIRSGDYNTNSHYFDTTVYRFLSFFAQIKLLEKDLIYLDTTISQKNDLRMLKYFRLFHEIMCDVDLFEGFKYDKNYQTDHFFTTPFYNLSNNIIIENKVMELDEFLDKKEQILPQIISVYEFFDSINPGEQRLRCERLKAFHLILMAFLNEYGYDFQKTPKNKYKDLKARIGEYKLLLNLEHMVKKFKLQKFCGPIENVLYRVR